MPQDVIQCAELCPDCPLRNGNDITVMAEVSCRIPAVISDDKSTAVFEFEDGHPANYDQRTAIVGLAGDDFRIVNEIEVKGKDFDSGRLAQAFAACEKPTQSKTGLFRVKKQLACTALKQLEG